MIVILAGCGGEQDGSALETALRTIAAAAQDPVTGWIWHIVQALDAPSH
jgi:hypothetical protein